MLKIGQKAPEFSLPNQDDVVISLKDFKGQKLLIWFFPKASTSGCTKEGIGFNEFIKHFNKQNISTFFDKTKDLIVVITRVINF